MLKPTTKRNIKRIIPFGVIWLVSGWVFLIVESAASQNFQQLPSTSIRMDFQIFFFSSIAMTAVGLLTGIIELKYLDRAFSKKRFVTRFLGKFLVYTLLFFIVVLMTFPIAASLELNVGLFNPRVWERYIDFFYSMSHLSTGIQLATALLLSLFYSEISEFIGQNALISFFTGKYHEPVEEERIFMFLDMKSSTTIAEKLGHLNYFGFLREYYQCFTKAIIAYEGEIYQYVGDEIILSWKVRDPKRQSLHRLLFCYEGKPE
jgi:adenylate cyclase